MTDDARFAIIDGKSIAAAIREEVKDATAGLKAKGVTPGLAVVLVGDDPASQVYVRNKHKACEAAGVASFEHALPASTPESELLALIQQLNEDPAVHGILVQLPLPRGISEERIIDAIDPAKDVDGLTAVNQGRLLAGKDTLEPCTPQGCRELLLRSGHDPAGKHVVIVGRSNLVGKPLAAMLMQKAPGGNATVTVCHSRTPDVAAHTREADIVVAAIGVAGFITADMLREGTVVIDVGINRVEDPAAKKGYRLVGDVDYAGAAPKTAAITPVPGGVGPMTVAMLLQNTLKAARQQTGAAE